MDKNVYETHFLPANNTEIEAEQYYIVQNDGTFQLLTKPIQYVTQEQSRDAQAQPCVVYNISSQQYYLKTGNSTELISVPDEYVLRPSENNVYSNGYLLQSAVINNAEEEQDLTMEECQTDESETNMTLINQSIKPLNDCTEITISNEQYQTLEQKGWILLESNDKILVLNMSGLHDITNNKKLIQKLRNESNHVIENDSNRTVKTENFINHDEQIIKSEAKLVITDEHENSLTIVDKSEDFDSNQEMELEQDGNSVDKKSDVDINSIVEVTKENDSSTYKIKTKLIFKDIPNKIILGKTTNGKRLVAKVVKQNKPMTLSEKIIENQKLSGSDLSDSQFIGLLRQTLRSNITTYSTEDITAIDTVVAQLSKVPAIRQSIVGQNLIVTKVRNRKDNTIKLKSKPILVTGRVVVLEKSEGAFLHVPNLLQNLINETEQHEDTDSTMNDYSNRDDITIFHVHVSETVCEDNTVRVDINLTKRQLSIDSILERRLIKTYACGACAAIFNEHQELKEHQENFCIEMDNKLTIDTERSAPNKKSYTIIHNGKKKLFSCLQCNAQFSKSIHCQSHIKTHFLPTSLQNSDDNGIGNSKLKKKPQLYKCNMCSATFYISSTLSKHIVSKHIKLKTNLHQSQFTCM